MIKEKKARVYLHIGQVGTPIAVARLARIAFVFMPVQTMLEWDEAIRAKVAVEVFQSCWRRREDVKHVRSLS